MVLASTRLDIGSSAVIYLRKMMANHGSRRVLQTKLDRLLDRLKFRSTRLGLHALICLYAFQLLLQSCEGRGIGTDKEGLLAFKAAADGSGVLNQSWIGLTSPCGSVSTKAWVGITCNERGRVYSVLLPGMQLIGAFRENTLSQLSELRYLVLGNNSFSGSLPSDLSNLTGLLQFWAQNAKFSGPFPGISEKIGMLDLSGNNLSGPIPDLSSRTNLTKLDLSDNQFQGNISGLPSNLVTLNLSINSLTGEIPLHLFGLTNLTSLDLSDNQFQGNISTLPFNLQSLNLRNNSLTGKIPSDLSGLTNLTVLDLSANQLQGNVPPLSSILEVLNLSDNSLTGEIPPDLARKFPIASFGGNAGLCGPPTTTPCPLEPGSAESPGTDASDIPGAGKKHSKTMNSIYITFIVLGGLALLVSPLVFVRHYFTRKKKSAGKKASGKKCNDISGISTSFGEAAESKISFFDDAEKGYDLEDLLCASAEMLGKGSIGTAYKAVMENGVVVAVKRARDVKEMGKKEFDQHMTILGSLKHPNLVPLRAYYYAKEERLLIYDFMPNGSLFSLLHGSRGPGRTPLEWSSRLFIAHGIAQGLTFLHQECESLKIPHGNLKSSNILMGKKFEVKIGDFGLVPLMSSTTAAQRMAGYRAPEYSTSKKISLKADVYSFGVLLLELLTGRQPAVPGHGDGIDLPRWVNSVVREEWTGEVFDLELKTYLHGEEEMVSLLQIAMTCVTANPEKRPEMADVLQMIESIRQVDSGADSESYSITISNSSDGEHSSQEAPQEESSNAV